MIRETTVAVPWKFIRWAAPPTEADCRGNEIKNSINTLIQPANIYTVYTSILVLPLQPKSFSLRGRPSRLSAVSSRYYIRVTITECATKCIYIILYFHHTFAMISFCALELVHTVMGYHTWTISVCRPGKGDIKTIVYTHGKVANRLRTATSACTWKFNLFYLDWEYETTITTPSCSSPPPHPPTHPHIHTCTHLNVVGEPVTLWVCVLTSEQHWITNKKCIKI